MIVARACPWCPHPLDLTPPVFFGVLARAADVERHFRGPPLTDLERLARQTALALEDDW
jgi:hypothetical protein